MSKKTPEEIATLKAKYGDKSAEKAAAKAAKKAKFGEQNAEQNMPVCIIGIPWCWYDEPSNGPIAGKEIDLDTERGQNWIKALEEAWLLEPCYGQYGVDYSLKRTGPYKIKIVRS